MHKSVLSLVCCLFFFLSCQEEIETMPNGSLNIVLTDEAAVTRTLPEALSDELRQQFTIELLRDREGTIVPEYKGALRDFGDQRVFKVGSYQLKAYLGESVTGIGCTLLLWRSSRHCHREG
jgi:TusA-related sulfurtransferase